MKPSKDLREKLDRVFPPPATSSRGQGGIPLHGTIQSYSMNYTSEGKESVYERLAALIEEERVKAAYENTLVTMEAWHGTDDEQFAAIMNDRLEALKAELQTTLTEGKK